MGIFRTDRFFGIVFVKQTFEVITGRACFRKTELADTSSGFPAVGLGTVIGMCAAMSQIIGLAFVCKEMFSVFAFSFVGLTQSFFGIAQGICCTCLADYPFSGHTFGKCIFVAFPCVVCTWGFVVGGTRSCFGIAQCICCTCLADYPFSGYTFGKCISVTFPGVVCTLRDVVGVARFCFRVALMIIVVRGFRTCTDCQGA